MEALSVTPVDVIFAVLVLASAGLAFSRGLVHETFAILEWLAAAYAALRFTPTFRPLLQGIIPIPWLEYVVVFIGTFLLVLIPLSFLCHRLEEAVRRSEVGAIDRTLGFFFGVARGLAIAGIGFIVYAALVPEDKRSPALTSARSYPLIRTTSGMLLDLVPEAKVANLKGLGDEKPSTTAAKRAEEAKESKEATYGAKDRRALDNLIEATGDGKDR